MPKCKTHRLPVMEKIAHIWPNTGSLAKALGLPYQTVRSWALRGIPPRRYAQIVAAAQRQGHVLTFEYLAGPWAAHASDEDAA